MTTGTDTRRRAPRTGVLVVAGLLVALLVAGVVSHYASDNPDGLERVAEDQGISGAAEPSATEGGPLADYDSGIGGDRISGGLAGVAGVVVVLALTGGLVVVLRRRRTAPDDEHVG